MPVVDYAALTDVGVEREHNEDYIAVNEQLGLFLVADGMGGHASGEVASRIAAQTIEQRMLAGAPMVQAIMQAHEAIIEGVRSGEGSRGMGTTVVALQLEGDAYQLAWVGDSRAYLWDGKLKQISKDHSLVQMLLDSGHINEAEARDHPRKNIIYQNLGAEEQDAPQVSLLQGQLHKGEKILLCSDGLSDELDDRQISEVLASEQDNDRLAEALVAAANRQGGSDNISVIVVSAPEDAGEQPEQIEADNESGRDTLVPE